MSRVTAGTRVVSGRAAPLRAFSLIEILISVLILALGLLGLGALFPVVLRDQRTSGDRVSAAIAFENVAASLRGNSGLDFAESEWDATANRFVATYGGLSCFAEPWRIDAARRAPVGTGAPNPNDLCRFSQLGNWQSDMRWESQLGGNADLRNELEDDGDLHLGLHVITNYGSNITNPRNDATASIDEARREFSAAAVQAAQADPDAVTPWDVRRIFLPALRLPLTSRLLAGAGSDANPEYVWDAVFRRTAPDSTRLQAAVFIRRIDPRIVRPYVAAPDPGDPDVRASLRQVFSGQGVTNAQRRLPLGVDADGLPTLDGTDGDGGLRYSTPITLAAWFPDAENPPRQELRKRDRIYIDVDANISDPDRRIDTDTNANPGLDPDEAIALVSRPGQRLVDNLGNLYTVVDSGEDDNGDFYVRVEPPVGASIQPTPTTARSNPRNWQGRIQQVLLTPQVPVAVYIMEVGQ